MFSCKKQVGGKKESNWIFQFIIFCSKFEKKNTQFFFNKAIYKKHNITFLGIMIPLHFIEIYVYLQGGRNFN